MRLKQALTNRNDQIRLNAIEAHAGFVSFVIGKVKKIGIENVLITKDNEDLGWLRKAYDRVLNFAEQVQIKQIPNEVKGPGPDGSFKLQIEIANENQTPCEAGNRISEFIEV